MLAIRIGNNVETYLLCAFFVLLFGGLICLYIPVSKRSRQERRAALEKLEQGPDEFPEILEVKAQVTDKKCGVYSSGTKMPQAHQKFAVTFLTDSGEQITLDVDEQVYLEIGETEKGTLLTINGKFYGFCPDENQ